MGVDTSWMEQPAQVLVGQGNAASSSAKSKEIKAGAKTVISWREEWRQLGLQAWSAESDSRRETQNPRSLSQEHLEELRSTLRKSEEDLRVYERDLWAGLTRVRKRIHVLARNMHFAPQQGDLRRMVQAAEHDLRIFAEKTRQEEDELAALECSLQDTLESSLVRFEGWCAQESCLRRPAENFSTPSKLSRPPSCSRLHQDKPSSKNVSKQLDSMHNELDKLEAEIAADGGSTGGWSHDDHETLLRVFRKFKRKTGVEFIAEAQQLLSNKTHEDLVGHIGWMLLWEERQLQKRQLVEKWRCMRAAAVSKEMLGEQKQELTAAAAQEEKRQRACSQERQHKDTSEQKKQLRNGARHAMMCSAPSRRRAVNVRRKSSSKRCSNGVDSRTKGGRPLKLCGSSVQLKTLCSVRGGIQLRSQAHRHRIRNVLLSAMQHSWREEQHRLRLSVLRKMRRRSASSLRAVHLLLEHQLHTSMWRAALRKVQGSLSIGPVNFTRNNRRYSWVNTHPSTVLRQGTLHIKGWCAQFEGQLHGGHTLELESWRAR